MDKTTLVTNGHRLLDLLLTAGIRSRAALWVHNPEVDIWRLWIVPNPDLTDKREFYRRVAEVISANRNDLPGMDVSDIEYVSDKHPAVRALSLLVKVTTGASVQMSNTNFGGFYLPDCIILQMDP